MCDNTGRTNSDEYNVQTALFLIAIITFTALSIMTIKIMLKRQMKIKVRCNNLIISSPVTRRVYGIELTVILPVIVLFLLFSTICVVVFSFYARTGNEMVAGWEFNKSRRTLDYIIPDKVTTILSPRNPCKRHSPPNILIIVCSAVDRNDHRSAIRHTWGHNAKYKYNASIVFLLGLSEEDWLNENVRLESNTYEDIIVENFIDSYNNLTLKSIMMLKWVKQNCNNVNLIMKTDDDVYLNIENLVRMTETITKDKTEDLLVGKLYHKERPITDQFSKWYVPCYMYPQKYYPSYICGVGYLMSINVAIRLYNESLRTEMIHIEDVFITGICAKQAGIQPVNDIAFHFFEHAITVECNSVHPYLILVSHEITASNIYSMHSQIQKCRRIS